jgi:uncharacterized protein YndB with AHSA1/START domain
MGTMTDRIEKRVTLKAPLARVWRAISDGREFGSWFGVAFEGPLTAGAKVAARLVPTTVDAEVAKKQEPYAGTPFHIWVVEVQPMRRLSFRWHPYDPDESGDPESGPTTLVTFELAEAPGGTALAITESGFDAIAIEKRAKSFAANEEGWTIQTTLIAKYLAAHAE